MRNATTLTPGARIALKHGVYSSAIVTAELPAAVAEIHEALAESLPYLEPPDLLLVERAARLVVQLRLVEASYDRRRSFLDRQGRPPRSWQLYTALNHQFRETMRMLGAGPAARAQLVGDLAGAQRDSRAAEAQERLRKRYSPTTPPSETWPAATATAAPGPSSPAVRVMAAPAADDERQS